MDAFEDVLATVGGTGEAINDGPRATDAESIEGDGVRNCCIGCVCTSTESLLVSGNDVSVAGGDIGKGIDAAVGVSTGCDRLVKNPKTILE